MAGFSDGWFGSVAEVFHDMSEELGPDDELIVLADDIDEELGEEDGGEDVEVFFFLHEELL